MPLFLSMVAKAETGDATAKRLVHNYHHRPAVELFDLKNDPLEMSNLAGQTDLKKVQINLQEIHLNLLEISR